MDISVLGPLTATVGSTSVVPTAAKPRVLLALLASYAGNVVPTIVIIEELWGFTPPRTAATTIQTYVLQLRRLIAGAIGTSGPCAKDFLRTDPGGYLLDQRGGRFDVTEYERLATQGYGAMRASDYAVARAKLASALDLWHGPAYVNVPIGCRLSAEATVLEESSHTVLERRIEADLHLGRHHELVGELAGLTAQHHTDERLHAHYMIALYRAGRRSQALAVFGRLRMALADELGLDPSPHLVRLHQSILSADPRLDTRHVLAQVAG